MRVGAFRSLFDTAKKSIPEWAQPGVREVYYFAFRQFVLLWCAAHWLFDKIGFRRSSPIPVPGPRLRFKVSGTPSEENFLETGRRSARNLVQVMNRVGKSLSSPDLRNVLDFGCGCGRALRWLNQDFPDKRYHGVDTDREMIGWCSKNLKFGSFSVGSRFPPSSLPAEEFDLIYAVSVFTHLHETEQRQWLAEFRRLLRPGGWLILTLHGETAWQHLSEAQKEEIRRRGMVTTVSSKLSGFFPSWYQTSLHTEDYVRSEFSKELALVDYFGAGFGHLDAVVLRKEGKVASQDRS